MMMIQDDRRIFDDSGLSSLPDDILIRILGFLDTKSSVQTCILSRRWTSLWKDVHVLTFNRISFFYSSIGSCFEYVDRVLSLRSDISSVSKVVADFEAVVPNSRDLLNRIAKYAASHGVRELSIYHFTSSFEDVSGLVYCYQSLKVLELRAAAFPKAYDRGLWSCLQVLESLTLIMCRVTFRNDPFGDLPRLESLKLVNCYSHFKEDDVLKVTASKLLNLEIVGLSVINFEIIASKLQFFILKIYNLCRMRQVGKSNLTSLNRANLMLSGYKDVFCDTNCSSDNDAKKQLVLEQCVNLFKMLHNVQVLNLKVEIFEVCNSVKYQSCSPFRRMKSLNLENYPNKSLDGVPKQQVVDYFLKGSRNEEEEEESLIV